MIKETAYVRDIKTEISKNKWSMIETNLRNKWRIIKETDRNLEINGE